MRATFMMILVGWLPLSAAQASEKERFIAANILAVFYHELGHAVIDVEDLPIFGQEEDAADVFSIYMIQAIYEEVPATEFAYDTALGFRAEADLADRNGQEDDLSGTHGPSEQRYYNAICIFYGADPAVRTGFARDLGLPRERAESCEEEYEQADHSWGRVLDDLMARGAGDSLRFVGSHNASFAAEILAEEAAFLNAVLQLAIPIGVVVEPCGEANAFYDPATREIQFCEEYEAHFEDLSRWVR
ncbi:MAG: DUF4344 domain-containing metallopeptidase [Pseudomonadota bacterium]